MTDDFSYSKRHLKKIIIHTFTVWYLLCNCNVHCSKEKTELNTCMLTEHYHQSLGLSSFKNNPTACYKISNSELHHVGSGSNKMMLILLLDSNARSYLPGHLLLERVELHPQVSEVGEPLRFIATRQKTIEKKNI